MEVECWLLRVSGPSIILCAVCVICVWLMLLRLDPESCISFIKKKVPEIRKPKMSDFLIALLYNQID